MSIETLYSDLKILSGVVAKKVSIPICRALWSQGDYLVVTDLETTVMAEQSSGFKLKHPVDCKLFTDAVKAAGPGGKITQTDEGVNVTAEGKEQYVPFLDEGDAELPAPRHFFERATKIEVPVDDLEYIYTARSTEQVRYALNGVCFDGDLKALVASDGKRLHWRPLKTQKLFKKFILGADPCQIAIKIMKAEPGTSISLLGVSTADVKDAKTGKKVDEQETNQISLRVGRFIIFARAIEGHFPDWNGVTPETFHYTICVDQKPLRQALVEAQSFLLKADKGKSYYVCLWLEDGNLKLMTRPVPTTTSKEAEKIVKKVMERTWTIPVLRKSGYPDGIHDTVLNPEYLMDAQWNPQTTTIQGSGKKEPVCIDGAAVVMPLTISVARDVPAGDSMEIAKKLGDLSRSQPRIVQIDRPKREPKAVAKQAKAAAQVAKEPVAKVKVKSSSRRVAAAAIPKKRLRDYSFRLFPWIG